MAKNKNLKFFAIIIIIYFLSNIYSFKPDKKEKDNVDFNPKTIKNLEKYEKKCKISDRCRECTYEELRTIPECQLTGYKEIQNCIFSEGKKYIGDEFITSSCKENMKMN